MKLQARFIQLPLQYDADLLAKEVLALGEASWLPHPQKFAGNDFLPLISVNGDPANESFAGPMAPTPYLRECPYLVEVLASLGCSLGRTRLMRLSGGAEVTPHVDINYYWRDRMRVHVPIVTQPSVSFHCGDAKVHMAAGECWIFDTWTRHRVINDAERKRIHLVADTVGGEGFWALAAGGRLPDQLNPNWAPRKFEAAGARIDQLDIESQNAPVVMTPWEVRSHVDFLFGEAQRDHPNFARIVQITSHFTHVWRALWSTYGEARAGWPRYRKALDEYNAQLKAAGAAQVKLRNGADLYMALFSLVLGTSLADTTRDDSAGEQRIDVASPAGAAQRSAPAADPRFDRPVFIVCPPRSGSSLLFETMAQAPGVYTVGGESHAVIEGVRGLDIVTLNLESNCLKEEHARPEIVAELRQRFSQLLRDRDGRPAPQGRVRMLEKTPKNALRVPFLAKAFPEARFIYLHREPRQVLASMMEAWESGGFRTYPNLPGWRGSLPWSLLLTPGWRDLAALPLNEIVAAQWSTTMQILLDSLERLPADRWTVARYDALLADPNAEITRLCRAVDFGWDRRLEGELPLSRHTVSKPRDDKWRSRGDQVEAVLPGIAATIDRAARAAAL
jgi:hypothetical protein